MENSENINKVLSLFVALLKKERSQQEPDPQKRRQLLQLILKEIRNRMTTKENGGIRP